MRWGGSPFVRGEEMVSVERALMRRKATGRRGAVARG
jgi:hypothetical protein